MGQSSDNFEKKIIIEESPPSSVYSDLSVDDSSYLIDVRTKPEWNFVGYPYIKNMINDIIFCEWAFYPLMDRNLHFENEIFSKLNFEQTKNLFFICRSGSRSLHAATAIQFHINKKLELKDKISCLNVKFGFEGDLSNDNKRGNLNGWKFSNLPWKQQ